MKTKQPLQEIYWHSELEAAAEPLKAWSDEKLREEYKRLCDNPPARTQPPGIRQTGDEWIIWLNAAKPMSYEIRRRWLERGRR